MHRHDLVALFWPRRDLFSPRAHPTNERQLWARCTNPSSQTGGKSRWPSRTMGGATQRMTERSLRVPQKSLRILSLRLNNPLTVASTCGRTCNMNLTDHGGMNLCAGNGGVGASFQRTSPPRVSYVYPCRSQLEAFRRTPSMTLVCLFHEATRKMNTQQPPAPTHRFTRHTVYISNSFPIIKHAIRSLSPVVHLTYQRWGGRTGCVSFHSETLGVLLPWCLCMKSACVVISVSQQSLAIAHDFSIFVTPFRRGPRAVQDRKS